MRTIKSIDVLSCAKISGMLYGCLGLLIIPFMMLRGLASLFAGQPKQAFGGILHLILAIVAPFFYGALGFLFGALTAWFYNVLAGWLGGIQIEIEEPSRGASASSNQFGLI
jgi:hypothetical protein